MDLIGLIQYFDFDQTSYNYKSQLQFRENFLMLLQTKLFIQVCLLISMKSQSF